MNKNNTETEQQYESLLFNEFDNQHSKKFNCQSSLYNYLTIVSTPVSENIHQHELPL